MKNLNRRSFILKSSCGIGAMIFVAGAGNFGLTPDKTATIDKVDLGRTGLKVSRLAIGTGSHGWKHTSAQKKLGEKEFIRMARHAFDRGVNFFETADMYGTHEFVGKAVREIGRENVILLSKVMVYPHQDWYAPEPFQKSIDRFRKELDTDYIDILLLHCMVDGNWPDQYKRYMDEFQEARQKGIIRNTGLSCHDMDAMKMAVSDTWADVLLARVNHHGAKMDGTPEEVMQVLHQVKSSGKGVIGMKIFGCGDLVQEQEREKSLDFVIKSKNVDCMTIGFESIDQLDDTISRIMRIVKS